MAKDEPKPRPPPEDPIQAALDAVERSTDERLADDGKADDIATTQGQD